MKWVTLLNAVWRRSTANKPRKRPTYTPLLENIEQHRSCP